MRNDCRAPVSNPQAKCLRKMKNNFPPSSLLTKLEVRNACLTYYFCSDYRIQIHKAKTVPARRNHYKVRINDKMQL